MTTQRPTHSTEALPWLVGRGLLRVALLVIVSGLLLVVVPRLVGQEPLGIEGGSMGDALPHGSLVFTSTRLAEEIAIGDVVVVRNAPDVPQIIHRVVGIDLSTGRRLATTRGDANSANDPEPFDLSGAVVVPTAVVPYVGYLLIFIAAPIGWLLGIALPSSLVTFLMIRQIWREEDDVADAGNDVDHWTVKYGISLATT